MFFRDEFILWLWRRLLGLLFVNGIVGGMSLVELKIKVVENVE